MKLKNPWNESWNTPWVNTDLRTFTNALQETSTTGMSTTPLFTESLTLSLYSVSFAKSWQKLQDGVCGEEKKHLWHWQHEIDHSIHEYVCIYIYTCYTDVTVQWSTICIYIYTIIHWHIVCTWSPFMTSISEGLFPPKQGRNSKQNKGERSEKVKPKGSYNTLQSMQFPGSLNRW